MADADDAIEPKIARNGRKRHERYLPQELVCDFLLRIPAQDLHDVMRHVCREWNLIIRTQNFIYHHLRNSIGGILIEERYPAPSVTKLNHVHEQTIMFVREHEYEQTCFEISKFDCWFEGRVLSSCNGLVLASDSRDLVLDVLYVINPLTKQLATLPPFDRETERHSDFGLAFVEASMEYKVVRSHDSEPFSRKMQVAVLTIGVDRIWRDIHIEHLTPATRAALMGSPLVTGGYMHWIGRNFILTLNVETETICRFPMPQLVKRCTHFLPMGSKLSAVDQSRKFLRHIWEMNQETGEWTLFLSFDLKPLSYRFNELFHKEAKPFIPLVWLVAREVLVFHIALCQRRPIAYNFKTKEIQSFDFATGLFCRFNAHVNSLVWFEGGL